MTREFSIEALVRRTMVDVARLATSDGARVSLARISEQVFLELTSELERQGVTKNVVADMFGMSLRTFHRRVQQVRREHAERRTVREAVLEFIAAAEPVSAHAVQQHFLRHAGELVAGALNDLVHAGLVNRSGWGEKAVYRRVVSAFTVGAELRRGEPIRQVLVAGERR
jgi:hypothetical protein